MKNIHCFYLVDLTHLRYFNYLSKNKNKRITTYSFVEEKNSLENKNIQYFIEKFKGPNIKSILISQDDIDYNQEARFNI